MNLVLLSHTTIENDLFGSLLFTICLRRSSILNKKIIIVFDFNSSLGGIVNPTQRERIDKSTVGKLIRAKVNFGLGALMKKKI